jgi:arylesterase/paraoxonase
MSGTVKPASRPALSYTLIIIFIGVAALVFRPLIELYKFKQTDLTSRLTQWSNHSRLNSEHCKVHYEADACEDIRIHWASSTAFVACGDPAERAFWYPPSLAYNATGRTSFVENLFKYEIKTKKSTKLRIEGLEGDFVNHGIDIYEFPDDHTKVCSGRELLGDIWIDMSCRFTSLP